MDEFSEESECGMNVCCKSQMSVRQTRQLEHFYGFLKNISPKRTQLMYQRNAIPRIQGGERYLLVAGEGRLQFHAHTLYFTANTERR